jgi:UDP-N-acetylmuramate dehydrogenase
VGITISENISLKDFTTFRIGGPARYFVRVTSIEDLTDALVFAQEKNLRFFILGGGSNIVMSDAGYDGLVIKMEIQGITCVYHEEVLPHEAEVTVGAGENWDTFVAYTAEKNLHGVENLSLIPGTVGAAPVQNIGAYGVEVKESIQWVEAVHRETGELRKFSNQECEFSYRNSFFKTIEGRNYVITRVCFFLKQTPNYSELNTQYKDISEYIKTSAVEIRELSVQKIREIVIDIRTKKLPSIKEYGTAGSFFKNPIIPKAEYEELCKQYPDMPGYPVKDQLIKVPAAWILDNLCGFKGYREGDVGVYKNQALVLVNFGSATFKDVSALAQKMIDAVKEKTKIILEREVEYIS